MEISYEELNQQNTTYENRLAGYFSWDTVFNLSKKILSDAEIKVLEKGLDYAPIQNKINEPELRRNSENVCRQMSLKWFFRNEPTSSFSDTPALRLNRLETRQKDTHGGLFKSGRKGTF